MAKFENDLFIGALKNDTDKASDYILSGVTSENSGVLSKDEYMNNEKVKDIFTKDGIFQTELFNNAYNKARKLKSDIDTIKDYSDLSDQLEYRESNIFRPLGAKIKEPTFEISKVQNPMKNKIGIENLFEISEGNFTQKELAQQGRVFDWDKQKFTDEKIVGDNAILNFASSIFSQPLVYARYTEDGTHKDVDGNEIKHRKGEWKVDNTGSYYCETVGNREGYNLDYVQTGDILTKDDSWLNNLDVWDSDGKDKSIAKTAVKTVLELAPYFIPGVNKFWVGFQTTYGLAEVMPTIIKMGDSLLLGDNASNQSFYKGLNRAESWFKQFEGGTSEYGSEHFFGSEQLGNMIVSTVNQLYQMKTMSKVGTKFAPNIEKKMTERYAKGLAKVDISSFDKDIFLKTIQESDPVIKELFKTQSKLAKQFSLGYMALTSTTDVYADAKNAGYSNRAAAFAGFATMASQYALMANNRMGDWMLERTTGMNAERNSALSRKAIKGLYNEFEAAADLLRTDSTVAKKKFGSILGKAFGNFKNLFTAASYGTETYWKNMVVEGVEEMTEEALSDAVKGLMDISTALGITKGKFNQLDQTFSKQGLARYMQAGVGGAIGGGIFQVIETKVEPFMTGNALNEDTKFDIISEVAKGNTQELLDDVDRFVGSSTFGENFEVSDEASGFKSTSAEFIKNNIKEYIKTLDAILNIEDINANPDEVLSRALQSSVIIPEFKKSGLDKFILSDYNKKIKVYADKKLEYENLLSAETKGDSKIEKEQREKKIEKTRLEVGRALEDVKSLLRGDGYEDYLKMSLVYLNGSIRKNVSESDLYGYCDLVLGKEYSKMTKSEQKEAKEKYKEFQDNVDKPEYMHELVKVYDGLQKKITPAMKEYADGKYLDIHKQSFNKILRNRAKLTDAELEQVKVLSDSSDKSLLNNIYNSLTKDPDSKEYTVSNESLYKNLINELNTKLNSQIHIDQKHIDLSKIITKDFLNGKFGDKTGFEILRDDFININSRGLNNVKFSNYALFNAIGEKIGTDIHGLLLDNNLEEGQSREDLLNSNSISFNKTLGLSPRKQTELQEFKDFVKVLFSPKAILNNNNIVIKSKSKLLSKFNYKGFSGNLSIDDLHAFLQQVESGKIDGIKNSTDLLQKIIEDTSDENRMYYNRILLAAAKELNLPYYDVVKKLEDKLEGITDEEELYYANEDITDAIMATHSNVDSSAIAEAVTQLNPISVLNILGALTQTSTTSMLNAKNKVINNMGEIMFSAMHASYSNILLHELGIKDLENTDLSVIEKYVRETLASKFGLSKENIDNFLANLNNGLNMNQEFNNDLLLNSVVESIKSINIDNVGIVTNAYMSDNTKNLVDGVIYDDLSKSKHSEFNKNITEFLNRLFMNDNKFDSKILQFGIDAKIDGSFKSYLLKSATQMYKDGKSIESIKNFIYETTSKFNNLAFILYENDSVKFVNDSATITLGEERDLEDIEILKEALNIDPTVDGKIPNNFILDFNNIKTLEESDQLKRFKDILDKHFHNMVQDPFEDIRKKKTSVKNPLYEMLKDFTAQLSDDKELLTVFDVLENEDKYIKNLDDIKDYLRQGFQVDQIKNAIKILKMFKGVTFGSETSIDNKYSITDTDKAEVFSYNQQMNNYYKRNDIKKREYKTVSADVIAYMNEDIDMLINKLEFLLQLSDSNSLSKVQENNKSELKYYNDLKKKLSSLISDYPDITQILNPDLIEIISNIDDDPANLDEHRKNILKLQQGINTAFTALITEKGREKAMKILVGWYEEDKNDAEEGFSPDFNKPVSNRNVLMFLATSAFTNTSDYIKKYGKIYEKIGKDVKIPFFTQQFSVKLGYSVAVDKINKTNLYSDFLKIVNSKGRNYTNIFFLDAVSGAGKTSVVASQILKMLVNSLNKKDKLNVIISAPQNKQVSNLNNSLNSALTKKEQGNVISTAKNKNQLFEYILADGKYKELNDDMSQANNPETNKGEYKYFKNLDALVSGKFKENSLVDIFNSENIRNLDVIFIDEFTHYNAAEIKILEELSNTHNIPVIALGDTFQTGNLIDYNGEPYQYNINIMDPITPPRINLSMRVSNIHKKDNIDSFQTVIRTYNSILKTYNNKLNDPNVSNEFNEFITTSGIQLHYYDEDDIQGDKIVDDFNKEDFVKIKKNLDKQKGKKLGILSDLDENGKLKNKQLKSILEDVGFTEDQLEYYSSDNMNSKYVQGSEEEYFVIDDFESRGQDIDKVKLIYTYVTRSLKGTIIKLDPTIKNALNISDKRYTTTSDFRMPKGDKINEMVEGLKKSFDDFLSNEDGVDVKLNLNHSKEEGGDNDEDSEDGDIDEQEDDGKEQEFTDPIETNESELKNPFSVNEKFLKKLEFGKPKIVDIQTEAEEKQALEFASEFNLRTYTFGNNLHYDPSVKKSDHIDDHFGIRNLINGDKEELTSEDLIKYSVVRRSLLLGNIEQAEKQYKNIKFSDNNYVINIVEYNENLDSFKYSDINNISSDSQITEYNNKKYQIYISQRVYDARNGEYIDIPLLLMPKYEHEASSEVFKQFYSNVFPNYKADQLHEDFKSLFNAIDNNQDKSVIAIKIPNSIRNSIINYNSKNNNNGKFKFGGTKGIFNYRQPVILDRVNPIGSTEKSIQLEELTKQGYVLRESGVIGNTDEDVEKLLNRFERYIEPSMLKKFHEDKSILYGQYFGIIASDSKSDHDPNFEKFMLFKSTHELNTLLQFRRNNIKDSQNTKLTSFGWMDKPSQKYLSYLYFKQLHKVLGSKQYKNNLKFEIGLDENGELKMENRNIIFKKYLQTIKNHISNAPNTNNKSNDLKFIDSIITFIDANRLTDFSKLSYDEFKNTVAVEYKDGTPSQIHLNHLGETIANLFTNYNKGNVKEKFVFNFPSFINILGDSDVHAFGIKKEYYEDKTTFKRKYKVRLNTDKVNQEYVKILLDPERNVANSSTFYYKGFDLNGKNKYVKDMDFYTNQGNINYIQNIYQEIPFDLPLNANVEIKKESESIDNDGINTKAQFGYYKLGNPDKAIRLFRTQYALRMGDVYVPFHILKDAIDANVDSFDDLKDYKPNEKKGDTPPKPPVTPDPPKQKKSKLTDSEKKKVIKDLQKKYPNVDKVLEYIDNKNIDILDFIHMASSESIDRSIKSDLFEITTQPPTQSILGLIIFKNMDNMNISTISELMKRGVNKKIINKLDKETQSDIINQLSMLNTKC